MKVNKTIKKLGICSLAVLASLYVLKKDVSAEEIDMVSESKKPIIRSIDSFYSYVGDEKLENFLAKKENRFFKVPKGYTNTHIIQDLFKRRLIENQLLITKYKQSSSKANFYSSLAQSLPIEDVDTLFAGQTIDLVDYITDINRIGDPTYTLNSNSTARIDHKTKSNKLKGKNYKSQDQYNVPMDEKSKPNNSLPKKNPNNVAVVNEVNVFREEELEGFNDKDEEKNSKEKNLEGLVLSGAKKNNHSLQGQYKYMGDKKVSEYFSKDENRFFKVPKGYTGTHLVQDILQSGLIKNPLIIHEYELTNSKGSLYSYLAKELPTKKPNILYAGERIDLLSCVEELNKLGNPKYEEEIEEDYSRSYQHDSNSEQRKKVSNSQKLFTGDNDENYTLPFVKKEKKDLNQSLDNIVNGQDFNVEKKVQTLTDIETFSGKGESYESRNILNKNLGAPFQIKESFELDLSPAENLIELYDSILNSNTEFVEHRLRYLSSQKKLNVNGELELLFGLTYLVSKDKEGFIDKLKDYEKEITSKEGKRYIKSIIEVDLYNLTQETNRSIKFGEAVKYFNIVKNAAFLGGINPVSGALNLGFMLYDNFVEFENLTEDEKTSLFFMQTHMRHFPDSVKFDELKPKFVDLISKYCMEASRSYNESIEKLIEEENLAYARFSLLSKNYEIHNITETYFTLDPESFKYVRNKSLVSSQVLEVKIREKENQLSQRSNTIFSDNINIKTDAESAEEISKILNGEKPSPKVESRFKQEYESALKDYKKSRSLPNLIFANNKITKTDFAKNLILGLAVTDFSNLGKALYRSTFLSATNAIINTTITPEYFTLEEKNFLEKASVCYVQEDLSETEKNEMFRIEGEIYLRRNHLDKAYSSFSFLSGEDYKLKKEKYLEKIEIKITSGLLDTCQYYLDEGQHLPARELYNILENREIPFFDKLKMGEIERKIQKFFPSGNKDIQVEKIQVRDINY